jgi:hypothetical protein
MRLFIRCVAIDRQQLEKIAKIENQIKEIKGNRFICKFQHLGGHLEWSVCYSWQAVCVLVDSVLAISQVVGRSISIWLYTHHKFFFIDWYYMASNISSSSRHFSLMVILQDLPLALLHIYWAAALQSQQINRHTLNRRIESFVDCSPYLVLHDKRHTQQVKVLKFIIFFFLYFSSCLNFPRPISMFLWHFK